MPGAYPARVDLVVAWGWACAAAGSMLSVPQIVRLLVGRTSAGVSLLLWQLMFGGGIGWTFHGVVTGHLNLIVPNAIATVSCALVLHMVARDRRLPAARVWVLGLMVAAILVAVELVGGAAAFGITVMAPFLIGISAQTRDLLRSPDLSGLSPVYVFGTLVVQVMWWSWALAAWELSTLICSSAVGTLAIVNVVLLLARTRGVLRPALRHAPEPTVVEAA